MTPGAIEQRHVKKFLAGCGGGVLLALIGIALGFHVSGFEATVIVLGTGFAVAAWWP